MTTIALGFEVGSGTPVSIPLKHMVVCGQTQESGKTTTLEALITRSGLRAVTFVTKRGEGSFSDARRVQPYFRDQGGWQYVASVLEASRGEKLKFERAWIIRASKGANSLADVQANVKRALLDPKIRGMSADVYLTLDAYLDVVVPTIAAVKWAPGLDVREGVNAVDLTAIPEEMQHLVIRSTLDWVLHREKQTVVVIPEAWKFLPQGRGTPVKLGAEAYIRQGAGLGNYLWLDSQDVGGIEKTILRSVIVWVLGVQREANEIKRTLENLPASAPKLTAADIASLELGQFYACYARHAIKTYVQPAWMGTNVAIDVAKGNLTPPAMKHGRERLVEHPDLRPGELLYVRETIDRLQRKEDEVTKDEADRISKENATLKAQMANFAAENAELRKEIAEVRLALHNGSTEMASNIKIEAVPVSAPPPRIITPEGDSLEEIYQFIKRRIFEDSDASAALLRIQTTRPEIIVEIERKVVTLNGTDTRARFARLLAQGFLATPRGVATIRREMARTGTDPGGGATLYDIAKAFLKDGFLVKTGDNEYQLAPGVKVSERERELSTV